MLFFIIWQGYLVIVPVSTTYRVLLPKLSYYRAKPLINSRVFLSGSAQVSDVPSEIIYKLSKIVVIFYHKEDDSEVEILSLLQERSTFLKTVNSDFPTQSPVIFFLVPSYRTWLTIRIDIAFVVYVLVFLAHATLRNGFRFFVVPHYSPTGNLINFPPAVYATTAIVDNDC